MGREIQPQLETTQFRLRRLISYKIPIFGICLGHQVLALALGAKTKKMSLGHRGANHPVKDLKTNKVEITSQNHGFEVDPETMPNSVKITHKSLFDGGIEGIELKEKNYFQCNITRSQIQVRKIVSTYLINF